MGSTQVFGDILRYLIPRYPHFDPQRLLPDLLIRGVISHDDSAFVQKQPTPTHRSFALFYQILPLKSKDSIRKCFDILRNYFEREDDAAFLNEQQNRLFTEAKAEEAAATVTHTNEAYDQEIESNQLDSQSVPTDSSGSRSPVPKKRIQVQQMISSPLDGGLSGKQYYDNYSYGESESHDKAKGRGGASSGISATAKDSSGERDRLMKGIALIINNNDYKSGSGRTGSLIDVQNISDLLEELEYVIVRKLDQTAEQMYREIQHFVDVAVQPYHKSCVVVVMAHGQNDKFVGIDGGLVAESAVVDIVTKSDKLVGKPKIFIFQACRGTLGGTLTNYGVRSGVDSVPQFSGVMIPVGADTCVFHSTMPGYYSWRHPGEGSWFISALCREFSDHAHEPWADLLYLATRVIYEVSVTAITNEEWEKVLQLPQVISNMRKQFHFCPGYEKPA